MTEKILCAINGIYMYMTLLHKCAVNADWLKSPQRCDWTPESTPSLATCAIC